MLSPRGLGKALVWMCAIDGERARLATILARASLVLAPLAAFAACPHCKRDNTLRDFGTCVGGAFHLRSLCSHSWPPSTPGTCGWLRARAHVDGDRAQRAQARWHPQHTHRAANHRSGSDRRCDRANTARAATGRQMQPQRQLLGRRPPQALDGAHATPSGQNSGRPCPVPNLLLESLPPPLLEEPHANAHKNFSFTENFDDAPP